MDEAISWGISLIAVFIVWLVVGSRSKRRTGSGTGGDAGRIRRNLEDTATDLGRAADNNRQAADDNRRAGELNRTATEQNERAQSLVRRARDILDSATHRDGDK